MTLRPCAARGCLRLFPVALPSTRVYCDDDCEQHAREQHARETDRLSRAEAEARALPCVRPDARIRVRTP